MQIKLSPFVGLFLSLLAPLAVAFAAPVPKKTVTYQVVCSCGRGESKLVNPAIKLSDIAVQLKNSQNFPLLRPKVHFGGVYEYFPSTFRTEAQADAEAEALNKGEKTCQGSDAVLFFIYGKGVSRPWTGNVFLDDPTIFIEPDGEEKRLARWFTTQTLTPKGEDDGYTYRDCRVRQLAEGVPDEVITLFVDSREIAPMPRPVEGETPIVEAPPLIPAPIIVPLPAPIVQWPKNGGNKPDADFSITPNSPDTIGVYSFADATMKSVTDTLLP